MTTVLSNSFTAANSVDLGIHPTPGQTTGGEGPVSGQEVQFNITFTPALDLPADHYFFVPQVLLSNPNMHFFWLSAPRPIVTPGTSFSPDLQEWIRNVGLDPDWLRVGTDIVGGATPPTFNATFSLTGSSVTAATFASASATSAKRGVLLRWRTASEANTLGFRIFRWQAGKYRLITRTLVRAQGAIAGAGYRYVDLRAPRRGLLRYRIQMIDRSSARSWFGPPLLVRR